MKTIKFKIMAENKSNEVLNEVTPKLLKLFEGLEGKQVLKVGADVLRGSILKKYINKMNEVKEEIENKYRNDDIYTNIFFNVCRYSVRIDVKVRFNRIFCITL